ncbi:Transposon TX1 uncharacterized 149 kDa protein [Vitis vinifera]|uniref:Transposon TX1 uncharacterized 149 kDa protein n=1 Tax=Vitis vinifera TaxID=29760 RepID=A0A438DH92_VITVI|nr:Transposon TX1 uncharacterized 149 kDa protein [Vitis vinifera]
MRLVSSEAEGLEIPFSKEEVFATLTILGKDKAPSPDGFTMAFWLFCWDVVKIEIVGFLREFHERGRFVKSLNATFLVLVPKKGDAEDLKDFRPINLVANLYKLLVKVLANRIKKMMGKVISGSQNAFVKGRQILDAILIANEAVNLRLKDNVGGVLWLKINLEKSELIPVSRVHDTKVLALELGCKVGGLPSCYLGLPLGAPFKSMVLWDGVEERFRRRLAMWKRQYVSKGGRLTLIQSTLSSMPIYFMSFFYLPRKARLRLEKIQRDFLWGGGTLVQKPHLVSGIGGMPMKERLFGGESSVTSMVKRRGDGALEKLAYQVGSGQRVRFWTDKWCGDEPICESFPSFFSIFLSKNAWVSEVWNPVGDGDGWTPLFAMAFKDWEIEVVEHFLHKIQAFRVQRKEEDKSVLDSIKVWRFLSQVSLFYFGAWRFFFVP